MRPTVAVVILTFNEAKNIDDCLESIGGWADEIFVVDSFSTDRTIDLVLGRKDPRISIVQHSFEDYSKQWNWAIANLPIKAQWTLKLDADERVPTEFKEEVDRLLQGIAPVVEGFFFERSTIFLGRRLRYVGVLRHDLRLWRTGTCRFDGSSMNEHALVNGHTEHLKQRIDHHDNKSITDWLEKHNRYSSMMAMNFQSTHYKSGIRPSLFGDSVSRFSWLFKVYRNIPLRPLVVFVYLFFIKRGFLSGRHGFHYCLLRAFYQYITDLKLLEWRLTGRAPIVPEPLRGAPSPHLSGGVQKSEGCLGSDAS